MKFELKEKRKNLLLQLLREHGLSRDQVQLLKTSSSSDVVRWPITHKKGTDQITDQIFDQFSSQNLARESDQKNNLKRHPDEMVGTYRVWKIFSMTQDFAKNKSEENKGSSSISSEFSRSSEVLEFWNGVGSVKLLGRGEGFQILEYLDGQDLQSVLDESTRISIWLGITKQLHSHSSNPSLREKLPNIREWFSSLEKMASQRKDLAWEAAWKIFLELQTESAKSVVLHGDLHHENIRFSERGWLALDPKGLIGEPALESAIYFYNPIPRSHDLERRDHILETAHKMAGGLKVDSKKILSYAYVFGFLSASWMLEDGEDPKEVLRISQAIGKCLL